MIKLVEKPNKLITNTIKLAHTSNYRKYRVGCIIAKGNNVISFGTNSKKTHPLQAKYTNRPHLECWIHAEIRAISRAVKADLPGADAYVMRVTREGALGNSRPCVGCYSALSRFGVKRIFYVCEGDFYREEM